MRRFLDRLIGRRPASAASEWICPTCGQTHDDLPAATSDGPLAWELASDEERAADFHMSTDTCVWKKEHFFVRCSLQIPYVDRDGAFSFGVWSSLSRENFFRYVDTFDGADPADLPPMFSWFSNSLPGYPETLNLKSFVHAQTGGMRPLIELEESDHPLSVDQRRGIPFAQAVAFLHNHLDF